MEVPSEVRWLDFSGATPMLIPRRVAPLWRGTTDRSTGQYRDLDVENPVTDYDHACATAWNGNGIFNFMGVPVLVLYAESDQITWDSPRCLVACGGWLPTDDELRQGKWGDPIKWTTEDSDYLLMNSAADGTCELDDDAMSVHLPSGEYTVECCYITGVAYGDYFHRFARHQS